MPAPDPQPPAGDPAADRSGNPPAPPPAAAEPTPAAAEPAPAAAEPGPAADTAAELSDAEFAKLAEQESKEEVIIVTGSTIGRKSLTTPAPLSILNRELLNAAGRPTVGDIIQTLPAQTNGINAQTNNGGDGSTRVDIRGLGAARTLTLINGRRVVPSGNGANSSVDLNTIPLAVIDRVEVLKDGASAVYGSDAVGGVVNIITRGDFEGTEATLYSGGTSRGDGIAYDASFVTGYNSENKQGSILFSAGVQRQRPVFAGDRPFSSYDKTYDFGNRVEVRSGSTAVPGGRINSLAIDLNGDRKPDPINVCGAGVQYCTSDGAGGWRPFVTPDDLYNFQPVNYLYTPSSRYNLYSSGSYKLRPGIGTFFEGSYMNRKSDQQLASEPFSNAVTISKDSMYNRIGGDILGYQRRLDEFGPRSSVQNINNFRLVGGFQGTIPSDAEVFKNFKWELSYNYGRNDGEQTNQGNLIKSRLANALGPSFMSSSGVPTCGTPSKPIAGCVPMDILGPVGTIDPAAAAYVTYTGVRSGFSEQQALLAQAHGRLAALPNDGDLSLAIGGDVRKEAGGNTPDPLTATGDTTGNASTPTAGSYNAVEAFGELSLVPVSGKQFAEWVEINLAARAFRYNNFGSGVTWKTGALFRTVGGVAFRGTYSTAFRAPSVIELYQGRADTFPTTADPCDTKPRGTTIMLDPDVAAQCSAQGVPATAAFGSIQQRAVVGGNPSLKAETAKVLTAGIVLEPPAVKGLSFTADYWRINITHAIQALGATVILANCYNHGIQSYCDQIHRNPALGYAIDFIDNPIANVGGAATSGVDFALAYDHSFGAAGRLREQLEWQNLFKYNVDNTVQILHGLSRYDLGARPKNKANFSTVWQHPSGLGTGFNIRFVGTFKECDQNNCNGGAPSRDVARWYKADVFAMYGLKTRAGTTTLTVGVNNVMNQNPPLIYIGIQGDSDAATYDYMGRFIYARMSQMF
ncbi:MAG: TonB-dependent receptor [Deltaproteobacteria bacterium]|nr:MAG: TonB-dependent receptor [Deltaproteobacteria bacterium]